MKKDNTITEHPVWLSDELSLRCLTPEDRPKHKAMSQEIVKTLIAPDFLIPMTEEEYDDTYTEQNPDVVYGIFDGDRLVATSSLLHDVRAYASTPELSEVMKHSCIEIGESMVLPEYRGHDYMLRLNNLIKDEARRQGVEYMLATAHPDNIASNTSLSHLGYKLVKEFVRSGYRRNLYLLDLFGTRI